LAAEIHHLKTTLIQSKKD